MSGNQRCVIRAWVFVLYFYLYNRVKIRLEWNTLKVKTRKKCVRVEFPRFIRPSGSCSVTVHILCTFCHNIIFPSRTRIYYICINKFFLLRFRVFSFVSIFWVQISYKFVFRASTYRTLKYVQFGSNIFNFGRLIVFYTNFIAANTNR